MDSIRKVRIFQLPKKMSPFYFILGLTFQIVWGAQGLQSAPRPINLDEEGRIERLSATLQSGRNFQLFVADNFEAERPWKIVRSDSFLNQVEFTSLIPKSPAFSKEMDLQKEFINPSAQSLTSLMVHSYCESPKREHWFLSPSEPLLLPIGIPVQTVLWVHSQGHHLRLKVVLTQKKSKDIYWELGELNFVGWRRLEVPIYLPPANNRLIQTFSLPLSVKGLLIEALPNQKKGAFQIYFDNLSFLIDKSTFQYSGSEVQDTWGEKR